MSNFVEAEHPRTREGTFTSKAWSVPDGTLLEAGETPTGAHAWHGSRPPAFADTSYALYVGDELAAATQKITPEFLERARTIADENSSVGTTIVAEAGRNGVHMDHHEVPMPPPGCALVAEHRGESFPVTELAQRRLTLFDVSARAEQQVIIRPNEHLQLEGVRKRLDSQFDESPFLVSASLRSDDPDVVDVEVCSSDTLAFREDGLTPDELDEHEDVIRTVYKDMLGAEIDTGSVQGVFSVTQRVSVGVEDATESVISSRAHEVYARMQYASDPRALTDLNVVSEVRRRIDEKAGINS